MGIHINVLANIIDITLDIPKPSDKFLVDTNVWFWMTYSRIGVTSGSNHYQVNDYPHYLNQALSISSNIFHTQLTLAELTHIIERTEFQIFEQRYNTGFNQKEFRHTCDSERKTVVAEVNASWASVTSLAQPLNQIISEEIAQHALMRYNTQRVDGYDLFLLEAMSTYGIHQIITDDGDFATVPNIEVYTSNRNVIENARKQKKLISR